MWDFQDWILVSFIIAWNKISRWLKNYCRFSLFSTNVNSCSYEYFTSFLFWFVWFLSDMSVGFYVSYTWIKSMTIFYPTLHHGTFLTSNLLHCTGKTGTWIQNFFHLLHVKTTSYMQQINEQHLHPPSSLSPFPIYLYAARVCHLSCTKQCFQWSGFVQNISWDLGL